MRDKRAAQSKGALLRGSRGKQCWRRRPTNIVHISTLHNFRERMTRAATARKTTLMVRGHGLSHALLRRPQPAVNARDRVPRSKSRNVGPTGSVVMATLRVGPIMCCLFLHANHDQLAHRAPAIAGGESAKRLHTNQVATHTAERVHDQAMPDQIASHQDASTR